MKRQVHTTQDSGEARSKRQANTCRAPHAECGACHPPTGAHGGKTALREPTRVNRHAAAEQCQHGSSIVDVTCRARLQHDETEVPEWIRLSQADAHAKASIKLIAHMDRTFRDAFRTSSGGAPIARRFNRSLCVAIANTRVAIVSWN
jgi:hypothetical protein